MSEPDGLPPDTKGRLLRAAIGIAAERGLEAATTAAIAEAAGVAEGTLYRHFESKQALLIAAYRGYKARVHRDVAAAVARAPAHLPSRFVEVWVAFFQAFCADRDSFVFGQRFAESALAHIEGGAGGRPLAAIIQALRSEGVASGVVKDLPPPLLQGLFYAPLTWMARQTLAGADWRHEDVRAAARAVWDAWAAQP